MPAKLRFAIDGCGDLCRNTVLPHLLQPDARQLLDVVALCDVVPGRATEIARRFEVPQAFESYEQMLRDSDADCVVIVVPTRLHAEHAIEAARHGKHIYVQKPMARTVDEAQAVVDAVRQAGVKLVAAPGQALWPLYPRLADMIHQGAIGKPYHAEPPHLGWGGHAVRFPTDPSWFFTADGGPMRDHGGYGINTLTALFGSVRRVTAFSGIVSPQRVWIDGDKNITVAGPDNTVALLDFGQGMVGLLPEGWCASSPGAASLRVHGLEGWIETAPRSASAAGLLPFEATVHSRGRTLQVRLEPDDVPFLRDGHLKLPHNHVWGDILHLVECVRDNRQPLASAELALHMVEVMQAAFTAAETGQTQLVHSKAGAA